MVCKHRWTGSGRILNNNRSITIYSWHDSTHTHGVTLIISKEKANILTEWKPISPHLTRAGFFSKYTTSPSRQCYAPTNEADRKFKVTGWSNYNSLFPKSQVGLITSTTKGQWMKEWWMTSERGCLTTALPTTVLLEASSFCTNHKSPNSHGDGKTSNQTDHVIIHGKRWRSFQNLREYQTEDQTEMQTPGYYKIKVYSYWLPRKWDSWRTVNIQWDTTARSIRQKKQNKKQEGQTSSCVWTSKGGTKWCSLGKSNYPL